MMQKKQLMDPSCLWGSCSQAETKPISIHLVASYFCTQIRKQEDDVYLRCLWESSLTLHTQTAGTHKDMSNAYTKKRHRAISKYTAVLLSQLQWAHTESYCSVCYKLAAHDEVKTGSHPAVKHMLAELTAPPDKHQPTGRAALRQAGSQELLKANSTCKLSGAKAVVYSPLRYTLSSSGSK